VGITAVRRTIATSASSPVSTDDFLLGDLAAISRQSDRVDTQSLSAELAAIFDRAVNLTNGADEPTASNTGLVKPSILTTYSGPTTITTANTTITDKIIDVYLDVRAAGFYASNCLFRGPSAAPTSGKALCNFDNMTAVSDATRPVVEDCEFDPQQPAYWINAIQGHHFIARRNKLHNCVDMFSVRWPSSATSSLKVNAYQNYWYDHCYYSPDPNHAGAAGDPPDGQTHNDGFQLQGGSDVIIQGNAGWGREYSATANSGNNPDRGTGTIANGRYSGGALKAVQWTNLSGYTENVDVLDNWFYGFNRAVSGAPSSGSWDFGRVWRNRIDDAQNERVGGSLSAGQGYGFRVRAATTIMDGGEGTANKNVYMAGLSGITAGAEATIYRNA
jgi:hypothetical protein